MLAYGWSKLPDALLERDGLKVALPAGIFSNSSDFSSFCHGKAGGLSPSFAGLQLCHCSSSTGQLHSCVQRNASPAWTGESFSGCPCPALPAEPSPFPVAHHRWLIRIMERGNLLCGLLCWEWALRYADEIHGCVIQPAVAAGAWHSTQGYGTVLPSGTGNLFLGMDGQAEKWGMQKKGAMSGSRQGAFSGSFHSH